MYDPGSPLLRPNTPRSGTPPPEAKARFAQDRLLDAVIWCEILPGETISEVTAMERFGLTRAAARAGLTRLGHDGWATPQARSGWLVLPVTGALIGQVLDARRIAEVAMQGIHLTEQTRAELNQIASVLRPLQDQVEAGSAARRYVERIDTLLLSALDPFTARHLRSLWQHTARITRFLENPATGHFFQRTDGPDLATAVLAHDAPAIAATRRTLIDAQEAFFLRRLLQSEAPLTPGSGITGHDNQAAINRRET